MASSCKFAAVPFILPTHEIEELLSLRLPLDGTRIQTAERTWPGPYPAGITFPLSWPARPDLKLNQFFYPTHASRWAEFHGLVDQEGYETIRDACFNGTPAAATFKLTQEVDGTTKTIETEMWCLPPKPVVKADQDTGLYHVTLVDERWHLQFQTAGDIDPDGSTWDELLDEVATAIGITIDYDATPAEYLSPHPRSALRSRWDNGALLLDAIAANTGRVIVRKLDGTYYAHLHPDWDCTDCSTTSAAPEADLLAGGDALGELVAGATNKAADLILPESVTVTFPYFVTGTSAYRNAEKFRFPSPLTRGDVYEVVVPIATALPSTTYTGFPGTKVFHDTAEALIASSGGTTPTNDADLQDLAERIAKDFYLWQHDATDQTTPGLHQWDQDGRYDMTWTWTRETTFSRIQRRPFNFVVEELLHSDQSVTPAPAGGGGTGATVNWVRPTSSTPSGGFYPGFTWVWNGTTFADGEAITIALMVGSKLSSSHKYIGLRRGTSTVYDVMGLNTHIFVSERCVNGQLVDTCTALTVPAPSDEVPAVCP